MTTTRLKALLITAVLATSGCATSPGSPPDATDAIEATEAVDATDTTGAGPDACSCEVSTDPQVRWTIQTGPLKIGFHSGLNGLGTGIGSVGHGAFYLYDTDTGTQTQLAGPVEQADQADRTTLTTATTDGRAVTIVLEPAEESSARVTFTVAGQKATERLGATFQVAADEAFYGVMERVVQGDQTLSWDPATTEGLDLRGQAFEFWVTPTPAVYSPFYVSSAGYGVRVDSDWPGAYDFGRTDPTLVDLRFEGPALKLQIFAGKGPADVTAAYSRVVGPTILPPKWAFGPWRWRDEHLNFPAFYDQTPNETPYNAQLVEDILMMGAFGIPCSVYWVDRPWGTGPFGYDDLAWDQDRFPKPTQMIAWLASRGTKFLLWIVDWAVGPTMLPDATAKDYLTTGESPFSEPNARLIDLTNPDAVAWWQDALGALIAQGVLGFKADRGEEKEPDGLVVNGTYHDGTSFREGHDANPRWYAKAVRGAFEKAGVAESVSILRAAVAGSQRYTMVWAGDTSTTPWGLRSAIIGVQRAAAFGFPLWGSDTCGYSGDPTHETCMRWLAFSAFTPLMEFGPTDNLAPWDWPTDANGGNGGAGPYYDEPLIAAWILYANLHDSLRDYSYAQAQAAHDDGTMFVRPMFFAYPNHPEYRALWDQYLYGPDLLVAPVWQNGVTKRDVQVPDGAWVDAWTGTRVTGPTTLHDIDAPAYRMPIYLRDGAAISLGDLDAKWQAALAKAHVKPDLATLQKDVK